DAESDQLLRQARQPLVVAVGPPVLDGEIPPFDVAEVPEPLSERLVVGLPARRRMARQVPDPSRLRPRRLRLNRQRRGEEGEAEERDGQLVHRSPPDGRDATPGVWPGSTTR